MSNTQSNAIPCPSCGHPPQHPYADYGWCPHCRDYHPAALVYHPDHYRPPPVLDGGLRCCVESLRAWAVIHQPPWPTGALVRCLHHYTDDNHVMVYCEGGHWEWARTRTCNEQDKPR
ncbi:hypothetical protein ABZ543_13210 [Streptomyces roseifaciens]